jgi:hypothetical protein
MGAPAVLFTIVTAVRLGQIQGAPNTTIDEYVYTAAPLSRGITLAGASMAVPTPGSS